MQRKFLIVFLLLFFSQIKTQEWKLVWSDEFDGETVDESKWEFMIGDGTMYGLPTGWGNNERQYYRKENATFKDGNLVITAKKEKFGGAEYTSARIRTKDKADWKFGKFEIRAKMPIGKGIWPALWMMPTDQVYGGWAASGEIDMVEYLGHEPQKVYGTLHFGGPWPQNQQKGKEYKLAAGSFHDDFHLFTFEWEEGKIRWYVDGALFQSQGKGDWWSSGGKFPAPFDQYFHLLFNLAVGGNWPGYPDASTQFPQELMIDYIRVYQVEETDVDEETDKHPDKYGLLKNYPNPFNPETNITFQILQNGHVEISIYTIQGDEVRTMVHEFLPAGYHTVAWNGRNGSGQKAPTGIYLCRLQSESLTDIIKMTLIQ